MPDMAKNGVRCRMSDHGPFDALSIDIIKMLLRAQLAILGHLVGLERSGAVLVCSRSEL